MRNALVLTLVWNKSVPSRARACVRNFNISATRLSANILLIISRRVKDHKVREVLRFLRGTYGIKTQLEIWGWCQSSWLYPITHTHTHTHTHARSACSLFCCCETLLWVSVVFSRVCGWLFSLSAVWWRTEDQCVCVWSDRRGWADAVCTSLTTGCVLVCLTADAVNLCLMSSCVCR